MKRCLKIATVAAVLIVTSGTAAAVATVVASHPANGVLAASPALAPRAIDPQTTPESLYTPVAPCRILDTRQGGGTMRNGVARDFYVAGTFGFPAQGGRSGGCNIPLGATAVTISFKVVRPTNLGFLHAWPEGTSEPTATALSWTKGASLGDGSVVPITNTSAKQLTAKVIESDANLTADVTGYYRPQIQALIGGNGAIDAGTSRVVSVSHAGTGFYYVTLDRPARQCSPSAVAYNYGHYASVGLSSSSTPNVVSVLTWNLNTTGGAVLADESFFLTVTC